MGCLLRPKTQSSVAQDDLGILCPHGVSTRATKKAKTSVFVLAASTVFGVVRRGSFSVVSPVSQQIRGLTCFHNGTTCDRFID